MSKVKVELDHSDMKLAIEIFVRRKYGKDVSNIKIAYLHGSENNSKNELQFKAEVEIELEENNVVK